MDKKQQSLNQIAIKLFKTILYYSEVEHKIAIKSPKVAFMGLTLYPNMNSIWNFDTLFLYKALQERHFEVRIHDPHVSGSEGIAGGVWLGRQSSDEKWTHSYDAIIISTPHNMYVENFAKLSNLLKPDKRGAIIDLHGRVPDCIDSSSLIDILAGITTPVDIVDFSTEYVKGDILGGEIMRKQIGNDSGNVG